MHIHIWYIFNVHSMNLCLYTGFHAHNVLALALAFAFALAAVGGPLASEPLGICGDHCDVLAMQLLENVFDRVHGHLYQCTSMYIECMKCTIIKNAYHQAMVGFKRRGECDDRISVNIRSPERRSEDVGNTKVSRFFIIANSMNNLMYITNVNSFFLQLIVGQINVHINVHIII